MGLEASLFSLGKEGAGKEGLGGVPTHYYNLLEVMSCHDTCNDVLFMSPNIVLHDAKLGTLITSIPMMLFASTKMM